MLVLSTAAKPSIGRLRRQNLEWRGEIERAAAGCWVLTHHYYYCTLTHADDHIARFRETRKFRNSPSLVINSRSLVMLLVAGHLAAASAPSRKVDKVLLVRVPKTASEALKSAMQNWVATGLCQYKTDMVHNGARPTAKDLQGYDKVIMSSRDPIDRFVSAFNWRSPQNTDRKKNRPDATKWGGIETDLYDCYTHVRGLANALAASRHGAKNNRTRCQRLAWDSCGPWRKYTDKMPSGAMVQLGASFYVAKAGVPAFLSRPFELVHLENLAEDMQRIYLWLGCDPASAEPEVAKAVSLLYNSSGYRFFRIPSSHVKYQGKDDTGLSDGGRKALRECLNHDYNVLDRLEGGLRRQRDERESGRSTKRSTKPSTKRSTKRSLQPPHWDPPAE